MTAELPDPLVPAEVDLRGYGWMPYYGGHLIGSELNATATDAEWRAAHNLWWAAWNQVPAASLPDDDAALARFADLGRDVKTWRKLRAGALHGFVKCSDGRFYHPFLARLALEAWERRLQERKRKAEWRRKRQEIGDRPTPPETGTRRGQDGSVPPGRNGPVPDERKREDRRGQDRRGTNISSEAKASAPDGGAGVVDLDLKTTVFRQGLAYLRGQSGRSESALRGMLGRWCRDFGDAVVIDAISAAQRHGPNEPVAWIEARLKAKQLLPERKPVVGYAIGTPEYEAERKRMGFPDFSRGNGAA